MIPPKCILIVDDEPNVRLVFRTALESSGYAVVEAGDGGSALARLRKEPADLILLDLKMPGLDGIETLSRLRDAGSFTPVVIVTAHGCIPDAVAAMKLGAADVIPKPVSPATLREVVAGSRTPLARPAAPSTRARKPLRRPSCSPRISHGPGERWIDASLTMPNSFSGSPTTSTQTRLKSFACGTTFARRATPEGFTYRTLGKLLR